VLDASGIVVTNYHVISDATDINVIASNNNQYKAEYLGGDSVLDIAVLKLVNAKLTPARLGTSSDLLPGETVIAIGNPYGLSSSVTTGVVSNTRRILKVDNSFSVFIQTDALINPGNSGGPLININGDVIGINSAIYREAQGIGFAIPIDTVKRILPDILTYKRIRRGYLGFGVSADTGVLIVNSIDKTSSAYRLGVRTGDVLLMLDNLPISTVTALDYIMRTFPPGESLEAIFSRNGREIALDLTIMDYPSAYGLEFLKNRYGIEFENISNTVKVVRSGYPQYIKVGDQLLAVNGKDVRSLKDVNEALADNVNQPVKLRVYSGRMTFDIVLQP
jgi:serine protease Do